MPSAFQKKKETGALSGKNDKHIFNHEEIEQNRF